MSGTTFAVSIEGASKSFGATQAVADLSLSVEAGAFFALLGPSGCGKTTLMRLVAGFDAPDAGTIHIDGQEMAGVPPERRPVNMMFQSYALFPHLSVAGNVGYGLARAGLSRPAIADGVRAMLRLVQLEGLDGRKPHQLSGGQKQRVALARAVARKPKILLLDEPMAALDRKLREETQFALKNIQRELGTTFIVVTHDQDEAMSLASSVAIMRAGRIAQVGTPADLYERPASRFVASFIGETNLLEGTVRTVDEGGIVIETANAPVAVRTRRAVKPGDKVVVAIRPERLTLGDRAGEGAAAFSCGGVVQDATFRGASTSLRLQLRSGASLRVAVPGTAPGVTAPGTALRVSAAPEHVWLLDD